MTTWGVWAVHLLTASGAALALAAALAVIGGHWQLVFLWLGLAMVVDGVDGPLARRLRVNDGVPWFSGAFLDLVVDYTTYVFVPALVLAQGPLLGPPWGAVAAMVVAVVGALYFGDTRMKTATAAFRGFPAVWNAVVFQLMVYKFPQPLTLAIIAALAALTFAPVEFLHPLRVKRWRPLTLVMTLLWAALAIVALAAALDPGPLVTAALAVVSLYFAVAGLAQQLTRS